MSNQPANQTSTEHAERSILLGRVLCVVMLICLIMGPGVGALLVNPEVTEGKPLTTVLGMPILYAWSLLWYAIMAGCVVLAYLFVWDRDEFEDEAPDSPHENGTT